MGVPDSEYHIHRTPTRDNMGYLEVLAETRIVPSDAPSIARFLLQADAAAARDVPYDYIPDDPNLHPPQPSFTYSGDHNWYGEYADLSQQEVYEVGATATTGGEAPLVAIYLPVDSSSEFAT